MTMILAGLQPRPTYRAGQIKAGEKNEKGEPRRLDGFRFTTHSEEAAVQVADLYEGYELRPWGRQWEVYTRQRKIDVALPPGKLVITQSMMRWTGGGPTVVCDGERTSKPAIGPCQCPQPEDPRDEESVWQAVRERQRLAGFKVPAGCKPHTWISVALPDIDGLGVWTLLSKSEKAASEIVQQARLLEAYRAAGQFCPAQIALEYTESRADGMLRQYNVPVLRVGKSLRSVAAELGGGELAAQLPPAPRERIAISAGPGSPPAGEEVPLPPEPDDEAADVTMLDDRKPMTARQIAALAAKAADRADIERRAAKADEDGVAAHKVQPPGDYPEMELRQYLRALWKVLPPKAREGAA